MASAGVVAFEFVINFGWSAKLFLKTVSAHKRSRAVHLVEFTDFSRNGDIGVCIVKLLFYKLVTENMGKLFGGAGLMRCGIQERGRFILHVGPDIVPGIRKFILRKIDFVRDFVRHFDSPNIFLFIESL